MRFNNLQIVRLVAAAGVAFIHLGVYAEVVFGAPPGLVRWMRLPAVAPAITPLFFAISGFVLTHVLRTTPPGRFLVHRAARLYPGYWLALALVCGSFSAGLWPGPYLSFASPAPTLETLLAVPPTRVRFGQYPLLVEWTLIYEVVLWLGLVAMWLAAGPKRLPYVAAAWLAVLAVKSALWPDFGSQAIPTWRKVWLSVFVAPFLLGVLAYCLKDRGRRCRWAVLAAVVALHVLGANVPEWPVDYHFWPRCVAAGLTVWFLVQIPDADKRNPLVVGGGYSYGLYLLHVPLILLTFRSFQAAGVLVGTAAGVAVAGAVALTVGLAFGRLEVGLHARVKRGLDRVRLPRPAAWVRVVRGPRGTRV